MVENPDLRNQRIAVCGDPEQRHGIVLTANYPAKRMGVKTGMANWQAMQACPGLVKVKPHYDLYLMLLLNRSEQYHEIYTFRRLIFILYLLYQFIRPALYTNERKYTLSVVGSSYVMFIIGTIVDYFIIFPLTVRFLGTYSVSQDVQNMLSLQSYMDTLLMMSLVFGIIFELPVISWLLTKFGIIKPQWMKKYRRHAIVAILIIAAIITPTADIFTLCIVSLPIWVLYEASILICAHTQARTNA